jgi:hypothetical protein
VRGEKVSGLVGWVLSVERVQMYIIGRFCCENVRNNCYIVGGCCCDLIGGDKKLLALNPLKLERWV